MDSIILENKSMQDESADQHPQHEKKAGHHINIIAGAKMMLDLL